MHNIVILFNQIEQEYCSILAQPNFLHTELKLVPLTVLFLGPFQQYHFLPSVRHNLPLPPPPAPPLPTDAESAFQQTPLPRCAAGTVTVRLVGCERVRV